MNVNALPFYDQSDNSTGCCPRFKPEGWDGQDLYFDEKLFVRAETRSLLHIPVNMGSVFSSTLGEIEAVKAFDPSQTIVLSRDLSSWSAEHFFAVSKHVAGQEMTRLSGHFVTKVFEGPYRDVPRWQDEMEKSIEQSGKKAGRVFFFYTTCPGCAKAYGENYVVGIAEIES